MMRRLIRTDGTVQDFDQPVSMQEIHRLIGAATADTVMLRHMGSPLHVMIVDDNGYETRSEVYQEPGRFVEMLVPVRALKPINAEATRLYHANCAPGTTHQIVGDVFVVPDEDFA